MRFVVVVVFVGACTPPPPSQPIGPCDVREGGRATLALNPDIDRVLPVVDYFFDESAGGPRTCHPGEDNGGGCDPCRRDAVELPIGVQTNLAIEVQNVGPIPAQVRSVVVVDGSDEGFVVLAPVVTDVDVGEAAAFVVGVTPAAEGLIEATLVVDCTGNGDRGPYEIGLQVVGVTP